MIAASLIASTAAAKAPVPVYFDFTPYQITPKRPVEIRRDPSGELVVLVPLTRGRTAVTTLAAFQEIIRAGVSPNWFSNSDGKGRTYVCAERSGCLGGRPVMLSRLICGVSAFGYAVRYRDGDRLNLRPTNLRMERRTTNAKLKEPEILALAA